MDVVGRVITPHSIVADLQSLINEGLQARKIKACDFRVTLTFYFCSAR